MTVQSTDRSRAGFSLIELLVVLVIIALLIGILVPALASARQAARAASTSALMKDLSTASQAFKLSNRRDPGYFSPALMGASANGQRGLSGMQNVMIDLAGGITAATGADILVGVGPQTDDTINIDPGQIGSLKADASGPGGYFPLDKKHFVAQKRTNLQRESAQQHRDLPEVIDYFGQPVLAWTLDERRADRFVGETSDGSGNQVAKFYWTQNAALLRAQNLGEEGRSQIFENMGSGDRGSLIGATRGGTTPDPTAVNSDGQAGSLATLLGNPSFPKVVGGIAKPTQPRGSQIFHSAGRDGVYLANTDNGAKRWAAAPGGGTATTGIQFGPTQSGTSGQPRIIDAIADFDDIVVPVNN